MPMSRHLRALGRHDLPAGIELDGRKYKLVQTFKHNSASAVGLYEADGDRVVLKCYRAAPLLIVPTGWAGRLMASHEASIMARVQDMPGVPRLRGRYGKAGLVRDYVPGVPLTRSTPVGADFFPQFFRLLRDMHRRGIAYVDLEKAGNILVGEDGRPHLIDFQVAVRVPDSCLGGLVPLRWLRRHLQRSDRYHAVKHFRRIRRGELTAEKKARLRRKPWLVRLSNVVNAPYKKLKRALFGKG